MTATGLRSFDNVAQVRLELANELKRQERGALAKLDNRNYWRNVGDIELLAVRAAESCIRRFDAETATDKLVSDIYAALLELAAQLRADDDDEDGYGVATVHEVKRVLE
jgi:hypothetical protein